MNDPDYGCGATTTASCASTHPNGHATWGCSNGTCVIAACDASFRDCNNDPSDGCEADLKSLATCGSCGTSCAPNQICTASGCASSCPAPNAYCNGSCVSLATTPDHCGSCTNACADPLDGVATCANNTCGIACATGYTPVNGKCVNKSSDPTCCGSGCVACAGAIGGVPTCAGGVCGVACPAGMTACSGKCVDLQRDVANCNGCGASCSGICAAGVCDPTAKQIIATGASPSSLAADGVSVFWIDNGTDIMQVARDGSSAPVDLAPVQQGAQSLAIDATTVYWVNNTGGGVWKATKGSVGATFVSPATSPRALAVNATSVYWVSSGGVFRMDKSGGAATPITVASGNPLQLAADDTNLFYTSTGANPTSSPILLFRSNLDGSSPVQIASGLFALIPVPFALGPSNIVYHWNHGAAHYVYVIDKLGGNQQLWPFSGLGWSLAQSQAIDATDAFFMLTSTEGHNGINRAPICGGPVENISPVNYADAMAIDDLFVYTVDSAGGIHRTAK